MCGFRAQELCENRGGRPGLPVPNSPYGFCGRKATLKNRAQELRERGGGHTGRPVPYSPYGVRGRKVQGVPSLIVHTVSVDVKYRALRPLQSVRSPWA